jgi:NhaP-type Na+/H+ or K+/H+ antiporter
MRSLAGSPEAPCTRCGARVAGLALGDRCLACDRELQVRASRLAGRISLLATLLVALYVYLRMPPVQLLRLYGAIAILATYVLVRRIVSRVAFEVFARETESGRDP